MKMFIQRFRAMAATRMALIGIVALTAGLACGTSPAGNQASAVRLTFFSPLRGNTFVDAYIKGATSAAAKYGAKITVLDGQTDPAVQYRQIQDATAAKSMDAAIVFTLNGVISIPAIKDALAAGIKVSCVFTPCGPDETSTAVQIPGLTLQIGSSPTIEGQTMAKATIGACAGRNPCYFGFTSTYTVQATDGVRKRAFQAALASHPEIKQVAYGEDQSSTDKARTLWLDFFQAHPEIMVAVTSGDQGAHGVELAAADSGKTGKVQIIGVGGSAIGVTAVKEGRWYSTSILVPESDGYTAAEYAILAAQGKKSGSTAIITEDNLGRDPELTKDNAGSFVAQWAG